MPIKVESILFKVVVMLTLFGSSTGVATCTTHCPYGFTSYQNSCYLFLYRPGTEATWFEANAYCSTQNAHLVAIETAYEYYYIVEKIRQWHKSRFHVWTGGNDITGKWQWAGGPCFETKSMSYYTRWYRGQPNNYHESEHCMHLSGDWSLFWNDNRCDVKYPFICEINLK